MHEEEDGKTIEDHFLFFRISLNMMNECEKSRTFLLMTSLTAASGLEAASSRIP